MGDHVAYTVFIGNNQVKMTGLTAAKDQKWVTDVKPHDLGTLMKGTQINFAVNCVDDNMGDATEIAWTLTAD